MEIIGELPRFDSDGFVFRTTNGGRPFSGLVAPKRKLDELAGVSGFTIHDLRRTVRTILPSLGIDEQVAESVLGHTLQGVKGCIIATNIMWNVAKRWKL